jgi:DNA-binding IclR family transcriptional regulator
LAGNSKQPGRSVSNRLLTVLGAFDVDRPTLSLTDISSITGLPLSTTRRLLKELTDWGALQRQPDQRYRIGLRLWQLGSLAPQQRDLRDSTLPFMQDLYEATHENVQLVVRDGYQALCIEKISATRAVPTKTEIGGQLPLHATAVGKVLLAFSPPAILEAAARGGLRRMTPFTIVEPGRLVRTLQEARHEGVAFSREEMTLGAISVASPVLGRDGSILGALGIVTHSHTPLDRLAPAVRAAALGASRSCAARQPLPQSTEDPATP